MKKFIATFLMMAMLAIALPMAASAQTYRGNRYYRDNRSFYDKHKDKINVGIGTGAGLILGGLIGGKRGAGIGALIGAGGSALYTYKIRKNRGSYYRGY